MATKKASAKSPSKAQAKPQSLAPKNGEVVKGGLSYKLENVQITSYSIG
jgi:hypothetical protein